MSQKIDGRAMMAPTDEGRTRLEAEVIGAAVSLYQANALDGETARKAISTLIRHAEALVGYETRPGPS